VDSYLTEALVYIKFLVGVSAWVDLDNSSLKFEFNWLKILQNLITILVFYPNFLYLILMNKSFNFKILFIHLLSNWNENIVPHKLRKLDWDVARVDKGNLGFLAIGHVVIVIEKVINEKAPIIFTKVWIIVRTTFTTFNLSVLDFSEWYLRAGWGILWIFKVDSNNGILNHFLIFQKIDIS